MKVIAEKTFVHEDEKINQMLPDKRGARIVIALQDGKKIEGSVDDCRGGEVYPYPVSQLESKFIDLCTPVLGKKRTDRALELLRDLESLDRMERLTDLLGLRAGPMIEIRIHGRGGQGAVVASKVMASAFFKQGKVGSGLSLPSELRDGGRPWPAYTRVDDQEITLRCSVRNPDHLIVLDQNLTRNADITQGLKEGGWIVINSEKDPKDLAFPPQFHVATVDASGIAIRHGLGSKSSPIVSTVILGAFAKATGLLKLSEVLEAIRENVPVYINQNVAGAREAYQRVKTERSG